MKWIAGNWKANGDHSLCQSIFNALNSSNIGDDDVTVIVCPPVTHIEKSVGLNKHSNVHIGAQNISEYAKGAFTGEIEASMLKEIGAEYVIIGHSERREYFQESEDALANKVKKAVAWGLKPIFCIGEALDVRESGKQNEHIANQLNAVINQTDIEVWKDCLVAYEPIWAIGTGKTANNEEIAEMHAHIRDTFSKHSDTIALHLPILYGGSVNAANAAMILTLANVDGALIGGASLKPDDFSKIIQDAASL